MLGPGFIFRVVKGVFCEKQTLRAAIVSVYTVLAASVRLGIHAAKENIFENDQQRQSEAFLQALKSDAVKLDDRALAELKEHVVALASQGSPDKADDSDGVLDKQIVQELRKASLELYRKKREDEALKAAASEDPTRTCDDEKLKGDAGPEEGYEMVSALEEQIQGRLIQPRICINHIKLASEREQLGAFAEQS